METKRRPSAVVAAELEAAKNELADLTQRIRDAKEAILQLEAKEREYSGGYSRSGIIRNLTSELAVSKRHEADSQSIPVVFSKVDQHNRDRSFIVEKVTAKTIFTRRVGRDYGLRFNLDGTSTRTWESYVIDIKATFGVPTIDAKSWLKIKAVHEDLRDVVSEANRKACCLNCQEELCGLDDDPNGEHNATCAKCRAEEDHDFDADPDAVFNRDGSMQ